MYNRRVCIYIYVYTYIHILAPRIARRLACSDQQAQAASEIKRILKARRHGVSRMSWTCRGNNSCRNSINIVRVIDIWMQEYVGSSKANSNTDAKAAQTWRKRV